MPKQRGYRLKPFDFDQEILPTEWFVEELFEAHVLTIVMGKSGIGKSMLVDFLAVCASFGYDFLGFKTTPSNVLIIDKDTEEKTFQKRLLKFGRGLSNLGEEQVSKLFSMSKQKITLQGTALREYVDRNKVDVVIIDCLHRVLGGLNPDKAMDMAQIGELKKTLEGITVILVHHISEKNKQADLDYLMFNPDVLGLSMGSSAIVQQADDFMIVGRKEMGDELETLYIRPFQKRGKLKGQPFTVDLIEGDDDSLLFEMDGKYTIPIIVRGIDRALIRHFRHDPTRRSVVDLFNHLGHLYTKQDLRRSLTRLKKRGLVALDDSRNRHYTWGLTKKGLGKRRRRRR